MSFNFPISTLFYQITLFVVAKYIYSLRSKIEEKIDQKKFMYLIKNLE
jgi:hypothetical protein